MNTQGGRITSSLRRALVILPIWLAASIWMWSWWLRSADEAFLVLFVPLTMALLYEFVLLPGVFLFFVFKAKNPPRRITQKGKKVAVITLCVPSSESMDIIERQLQAMSAITYPHDSWILDEGDSEQVKALAKKYKVKHFSRKHIAKYNQELPPFKAKTKAGNVNAWLDHVKRRKYEFFVQFDIDHLAKPEYLDKTLRYFNDKQVAWVQAPSVYENLNHWTARGAAEQELVLQGPLQMGFYGLNETPFIIGSHCTYRMSAIREINGFQPTRAEDHLDTVVLASRGYKGVFVPEVIAEGDGPETLNTYLAQQFAWAYSMFQVLTQHSRGLLRGMSLQRKLLFLFAQTWYPLWSLTYLMLFVSPLLALLINRDIASVDRGEFLTHFLPVYVSSFLIWWVGRPLMNPRHVGLTWRGILLHVVRWPVILLAIINAGLGIKKPYMITPKGNFAKNVPSVKTYQPFLLLGAVSTLTIAYASRVNGESMPEAQAVFALVNAGLMLSICLVDISLRLREVRPALKDIKAYWMRPIGATFLLAVSIGVTTFLGPVGGTASRTLAAENQSQTASQSDQTDIHPTLPLETLVDHLRQAPTYQAGLAQPQLGMYNTSPQSIEQAYIQHEFVDWREPQYLAYVLAHIQQQGNVSLVTIEPRGDKDGKRLLEGIVDGTYDETLQQLAEVVAASKNPVYVRFAHEMDLAQLYPWGNQDPALFIKTYHHVIQAFKSHGATQARWVWSPAGNDGAEAYYPGDEYVDVIGTTILYDAYWYGKTKLSFSEVAQRRQWLQAYGKPVWVVEFGVGAADRAYQQELINDALATYRAAGYHALVYLNMRDANIVGPDYHLLRTEQFMQIAKQPQPIKARDQAAEYAQLLSAPLASKKSCRSSMQWLDVSGVKTSCTLSN